MGVEPWVFDIGVQREVFVPEREEEAEGWGMNWYYEELYSWSSFCILKMSELRKMRMTGAVARVGAEICLQNFQQKVLQEDLTCD
jgi:hypothetical protein